MEKTILNIKQMCQVNPYSYKLVVIPYSSLKTLIYKVLSDNDISAFNLDFR